MVIDEIHEYHGFFGGNMALLLRRFFLHLDRIGASPRVFLSTATCANPEEHARNLTGRRNVELVSARDVFRPKRHFVFVKPDIPDFRYRDSLRLRVENTALCILEEGLQALVFCPTKRFLEDAFRDCQRKAKKHGLNPKRISAFHADLKSENRQEIQQKVKAGDINMVFTTNALELGLDIGGLDGIILAGFPPRISSAWQQIGRAGRSWDKDAFVLFYAMNDPIDRFYVGKLDAFLNKPFDELVIDPDNEALIRNHLPMIVEETGGDVRPSDEAILGSAFYKAAKNGGKPPKGGYKPHPGLKLRGGFGQSFHLKRGEEEIGKISAMRRFREAYIGAIFTFFGRKYRVSSHEEKAVVLTDVTGAESSHRTEAGFYSALYEKDIFDGFGYGDVEVHYGSLDMITNFTGYKRIDERSGEEMGKGGAESSYSQNGLHAFLVKLPQDEGVFAGIGALEHMLRVGAMFVIPSDRFDASTWSRTSDDPTVFYYENHSGGIGVAKKLFNVWRITLEKGMEIAQECGCRRGCQNCIEPAKSYNVSNADIDKTRGFELAKRLLERVENGPKTKFKNGRMVPI